MPDTIRKRCGGRTHPWRERFGQACAGLIALLPGAAAAQETRIGDTLEFRPGVAAAELAHHFGAAANKGFAQKAVRYGHQAGRRALQEVAAEVAVRHFRRALELLDRFGPEDQALRCELLLDLAGGLADPHRGR